MKPPPMTRHIPQTHKNFESGVLAGSISTVYKGVSYTKERPIGAIGAVRARGVHHMRTQCVGLHRGRTTEWTFSHGTSKCYTF